MEQAIALAPLLLSTTYKPVAEPLCQLRDFAAFNTLRERNRE